MTSTQLRIAVFGLNYAPEPTGNAPYTTRLSELLAAEGHHVNVHAGYPYYPEWKLAAGYTGWSMSEVLQGVKVRRRRHFIPPTANNRHRMHMELSFGLRLVFSRWHRPDAVLVVSPALFSTALVVLRSKFGWRKPPTGVWVQDIYSCGLEEMGAGNSLSARIVKKVEGYVLRSASKVTVIHDRFADYLTSELGVPAENVSVIRNWTHLRPAGGIDRAVVRKRFGWADDDVIVLHAGNMGAKQGLGNVVEAARLADAAGSRVRFVLVGDGNQRDAIQKLAKGVDHIQFIAPLADQEFQEVLQSADILLVNELAGLREMSVPSKLTSYFSTLLPVIAATEADSTTAGEIKVSGAGLRVDPNSPEALLGAAECLGQDKLLSQKLGRAGRSYAESTLSEEAAIVQYSAWLRDLAAVRRSIPGHVTA